MLASHSQYLEKLNGRMKVHCRFSISILLHMLMHILVMETSAVHGILGFVGLGLAPLAVCCLSSSVANSLVKQGTAPKNQANQTTPRCGASPLNFSILSLWVCHQSRPAVLWELWLQFLLLRLSWVLCGTGNPPKPSRWKPLLSCRSPGGRT